MYGMSRLTEDEAVFLTSAMIYQDLVNVPTARRSSQKRGKINHQPAFTQGKKLLHHSREIPDDPSQHYYYDIYHKPPHESHLGVSGECCNDVKQHAIPSSSQDDLARAIQDVNMQKRSTSAFFINQDLYRSPDAFLSSLPLERRYLRSAHTSQSIPWNSSNQALRLSKEWTEKIESRANKRTSQVLGHRVDKLYMMNGNAVRLQPKYDVSDEELRHLKQLAKVREEVRGETRQSKHLILIPESEDSGEGFSQGDEGIEERVSEKVPTGPPMTEKLQTGDKKLVSLSMRADSPESGFQGEEHLSSIMGGAPDTVPGELPAARPPSIADLEDEKVVPALQLEPKKPQTPNPEPEIKSDNTRIPGQNVDPEATGVTVSDIMSHGSTTPLKPNPVDSENVSNMKSEAPPNVAMKNTNAVVVEEEDELTPREIARSLCLQPGEGCYSLMPDRAEGYNSMRKWCSDYTSYPHRKMVKWNIRFPGKFPVRKSNMKYNVPSICECECRKSSVFLSLEGVHVPTTCKH